MGWACDRVSAVRRSKGPSLKKVPPVGKWLAISSLLAALAGIPLFVWLDPMSIFNSFFTVFSRDLALPLILSLMGLPLILAMHLVFPDLWCSKLCPLGGLQDEMTTIRKLAAYRPESDRDRKRRVSAGRRLFLSSGGGLLAGFLLPSFLKPATKAYLQPPGAQAPDRFNTLCLRCGNCIKACPTGILHQHMDTSDLLSWMVPEIAFRDSYCLETCNLCSRVCPSGAISPFSTAAKSNLVIGIARVEADKCLLAKNKECDRCKAVCTYDAIRIETGDIFRNGQVVIDGEKCTGCGACAVICPPRVIEILPSNG
jgi:ferredoxin-type protein NapF